MTENKKIIQFSMVDIIERKIHFTNTNTIFDKIEYQYNDEGELQAYNEMLVDVKVMDEDKFVSKYLNIVDTLAVQFEKKEFTDEKEIEKMSGYNNAIVSILECINPIFKYDLND
ncbi:hypothetical protein [Neobacillus drentensis]|uniref:hypothetical protein n=1 Tax=Neobacillus drentensis TaxID=220684 RepID=UPI0008260929|nr:hypothetical protein [Neobacillus drentensis]